MAMVTLSLYGEPEGQGWYSYLNWSITNHLDTEKADILIGLALLGLKLSFKYGHGPEQ